MADKLKQTVHVFLLIMAYALHRVTEELKQEPAGEEEEDEEEEDANLPTYTALRRIRTLCLRRLMESVGYFPSVNYALYASYYFAPLTPLLERLPTSCRHSKKAPTLLHLAMIISCNSQLFYIFHLQPLLVQQSVRCLLDNEDLFSTGRTDKGRTASHRHPQHAGQPEHASGDGHHPADRESDVHQPRGRLLQHEGEGPGRGCAATRAASSETTRSSP